MELTDLLYTVLFQAGPTTDADAYFDPETGAPGPSDDAVTMLMLEIARREYHPEHSETDQIKLVYGGLWNVLHDIQRVMEGLWREHLPVGTPLPVVVTTGDQGAGEYLCDVAGCGYRAGNDGLCSEHRGALAEWQEAEQ